ncbi:trehalose hydrolase [Lactobacillus amylovorus]|uniref:trehalose hydrolase n=1 Tax=Lactobacillus amylovorus TaxID=1604 RepID=UPI000AFAC5FF|nr:trehalose hydrolase [Lactobacillus amylovorus]
MLVFTNFYGREHTVKLPEKYQGKEYQVLLSNYDAENGKLTDEITLAPYEALAIKIK